MIRHLLATTLAAGGLVGTAAAQDVDTKQGPVFCTAEYNPAEGDMEGADRAASEFAEMDTDGDGMVSQSEYIACKQAAQDAPSAETDRAAANLPGADTDGDGTISYDEYMAAAREAHAAAAAAASAAAEPVIVIRRFVFIPATGADADIRGMSGAEAERRSAVQFSALDTDGDGSLTEAEWGQRSTSPSDRPDIFTADFEEIDANRDGTLSQSEYQEAFGS